MYSMVKHEFKKTVFRAETYVMAIIVAGGFFLGVLEVLPYVLRGTYEIPAFLLYFNSIHSGIIDVILPVVCVIPVILSLWDECNSGYVHMILMRTSKVNYIMSKITVAIFTGIYVVVIGSVIFFFLVYVVGMCREWDLTAIEGVLKDSVYYEWAQNGKEFQCVILMVGCYSMTTIPWTMITLAASQIIKNKYILISVPLIIKELLLFVCHANIDKFFYVCPTTWNVATSTLVNEKLGGLMFVVEVMIVVTVICSVGFIMFFKRKFKNG